MTQKTNIESFIFRSSLWFLKKGLIPIIRLSCIALQDAGRTGFMVASLSLLEMKYTLCQAIASLTNDYAEAAHEGGGGARRAFGGSNCVWETWVLSHQNAFVPTDAPVLILIPQKYPCVSSCCGVCRLCCFVVVIDVRV